MIDVRDLVPTELQALLHSVVPEFYVVGGAVRDTIAPLPQVPRDVDIVLLRGKNSGWDCGTRTMLDEATSIFGIPALKWFDQYGDAVGAFKELWEGLAKVRLDGMDYDILFAGVDTIEAALSAFDYNVNQVALSSAGKLIVQHDMHPKDALVRLHDVPAERAANMRARYKELGYTGEFLAYD